MGARSSPRRRLTVLAVVLAGVAAVGVGAVVLDRLRIPQPEVRADLLLGVAADFEGPDAEVRAEQARRIAALGVATVRDDVRWSTVQPDAGRYDWRGPDGFFAAAAAAGRRPLPVLDSTPGWAGGAGEGERVTDDPAAYARFVGRAVARYGPGGAFWRERPRLDPRLAPVWFELYNEPYNDGLANADRYARAVAAAVPAGRRANPRARFLFAASTEAQSELPWVARTHAAVPGLPGLYDGVAMHSYPERPDGVPFEALTAELGAVGAAGKPVWLTEVGWATCTRNSTCVSARRQASNLAELLENVSDRWSTLVKAVVVYQIDDYKTPPDDREGYFGLLRRDGSRKPAWSVLRSAATR